MPTWSDLPSEMLQYMADKQTNYVDYVRTRAVCKSWRSAIAKRPLNKIICQLPFLLLPYYQKSPHHRGFYNIADDNTYRLELPQAYEKRCCGSSHGWLIVVEKSPAIFLLNPLTTSRIDLPSLSTFSCFPTHVVFHNSRNFNDHFILREKHHVRDTFIVKAILSADPSLTPHFTVAVIYGFSENVAFCTSGDSSWTLVYETSPTPPRFKDVMFLAGKLYAVDQWGKISICNIEKIPAERVHVCDPPSVSPLIGYKQWYLASLNDEVLLVGRYRKVVPDYEYKTERFEVYKLESNGGRWRMMGCLGDKILFLGWNSSLSISALDYPNNCKGNCIYFTDDYMRICRDHVWEGHDFGVFDLDDGSIRSLSLPKYLIKQPCFTNIFYFERSLYSDRSLFILPPPIWVTLSP